MDVVGLIISVLGILLAVIFYFLALRDRKPTYAVISRHVVAGDAENGIGVTYNGVSVPRVNRALVIFWNNGHRAIDRESVVPEHPLTMAVPDGATILSANVAKTTRNEIDVEIVRQSEVDVELAFSHLEYHDGFVVDILHTGARTRDLDVSVAILDSGGRNQKIQHPIYGRSRGMIVGNLTLAAFTFVGYVRMIQVFDHRLINVVVATSIMGTVLLVCLAPVLTQIRYGAPRNLAGADEEGPGLLTIDDAVPFG